MMPHGRHINTKASDMAKSTMCTYPQSDNELPHWKYVLWCCADFPCINLPDQETDKIINKQHPQLGFTFIISFHVSIERQKYMLHV